MNHRLLAVAGLVPAVFAAPGLRAQVTQQEFVARKEAKLAEEWLGRAEWNLDYDAALELATAEGKRVLAYFTRSYAP